MLGRMRKRLFGGALRRILVLGLLGMVAAGATLGFSIKPAHAWTRGHDTIIFLHGFTGGSSNTTNGHVDCGLTWNSAINYLQGYHTIADQSLKWIRQDFRVIQFYNNDVNCGTRIGANAPADPRPNGRSSEDLHNYQYTNHCSGYYPDGTNASLDGTEKESLYHLSCLFAWYLYLNYDRYWNVEIVAHSMGGLIVRNTIYQIWKSKATWTMPPFLPNISDVVTMATPHGGTSFFTGLLCGGCTQAIEMISTSDFMKEMQAQAQNPQSGATDWTMLGSNRDPVGWQSGTYMDGGHRIIYMCDASGQPCYDHGGYLYDTADSFTAHQYYCDWCSKDVSPAGGMGYYSGPHSLHEMFYALWRTDW